MTTYSEQWRRETEAREWLRRMDRDPARIKALLLRIEQKRGKAAAEQLREDMRAQWQAPAPIPAAKTTGAG